MDIVAREHVLYMNLVTGKNPDLAICVGRMLDLQYSCGLRNETSPILYVFVDEFQDLASEEFANFITEEAMGVELDGATTAKGSLVVKGKPLVHPNVFLSLAQSESIVFGAKVTPAALTCS
ncbi:MAG: hypothetical protein QXO86_06700 [Nitrososphaerota archaeon]